MNHPENRTALQGALDQVEQVTLESFRMAERIMSEMVKHIKWTSDDARDRYLSQIPMLALELKGHTLSVSSMLQRASKSDIESTHEAMHEMLVEMKKRNDEYDKQTKKGDTV